MHFRRVAALQVMHQLAYLCFASRRSVHVDDVSTVVQDVTRRSLCSIIHIHFLPSLHHVVLGDEDDIRVAEFSKVLAGYERVRVHQRRIVSRPSRFRTAIRTLDLYVVFSAFGIPREHVEPDTSPLEALDWILGLRLDDLQVFLSDDYPQYQLNALKRVLQALRHEVVVHEPEILEQCEALRVHHGCRTRCLRLSGDGSGCFALLAMHTSFRHVDSFILRARTQYHQSTNACIIP